MGSKKMFFILLIIAAISVIGIPVILRTINNSRVKTFNSTISQYVTAVKSAYMEEEIQCYAGNTSLLPASYLGDGEYYIPITTSKNDEMPQNYATNDTVDFNEKIPNNNSSETVHMIAQENSQALLKKGGKSPYGSDMYGYVKIIKNDIIIEYDACLIDMTGHGIEHEEITLNHTISYAPSEKKLYICKFVN